MSTLIQISKPQNPIVLTASGSTVRGTQIVIEIFK
jgi:hypothetical protein